MGAEPVFRLRDRKGSCGSANDRHQTQIEADLDVTLRLATRLMIRYWACITSVGQSHLEGFDEVGGQL